MNKLKKQKYGITLVSLVVTVIVLLILSGVALNFTIGENRNIYKSRNSSKWNRNSKS